jgi:WD40 repeat protein
LKLFSLKVTVSAVGINDLTGDILTAAGTFLFYWDMNGHLLAKLDIADGQAMPSDQILCVGFSQVNEWDPLNVIVTGGNDGCFRLWSEELVRVAQEEESAELLSAAQGDLEDDQIISIRRLSIHGQCSLLISAKTLAF